VTNRYTQNQYKQIETKKNNIATKQTIIYEIHCRVLSKPNENTISTQH